MMKQIKIAVCSVKRSWHAHLVEFYMTNTKRCYKQGKFEECVISDLQRSRHMMRAIEAELQRRKLKEG